MGCVRSRAAAAVWNGKFIVCGGYHDGDYLKSMECFDPESGVWTELSDMPTALVGHSRLSPMKKSRASFAAAVLDNEIFTMGGTDETDPDFDKCEIFNGRYWRDAPHFPLGALKCLLLLFLKCSLITFLNHTKTGRINSVSVFSSLFSPPESTNIPNTSSAPHCLPPLV